MRIIGRKFKSGKNVWKVIEKNNWQGNCYWVELISGRHPHIVVGEQWVLTEKTILKNLKTK